MLSDDCQRRPHDQSYSDRTGGGCLGPLLLSRRGTDRVVGYVTVAVIVAMVGGGDDSDSISDRSDLSNSNLEQQQQHILSEQQLERQQQHRKQQQQCQ